MDTINKHRKKLLAPYNRSVKADEVIASAKRLAHLILSCKALLHRHKKKILSDVLWLISEADGKFSTRYRSKEVFRLAHEVPNCEILIQHEHVYPRKAVIEYILDQRDKMLKDPTLLEQFLDKTVGCVITREEHCKLKKACEGWKRYKYVPVLDMSKTPPKLRK